MNSNSPTAARDEDSPPVGHATAYAFLVMTALLWSIGIVMSRGVHEFIPPLGMTFWRWFGAAVILWPFVARQIAREWPIVRPHLGRFIAMGTLIVGSSALLVFALRFTTATNGALLNSSQPAMTVLVAWLLFRTRVSGRHVAGLIIAAVGVAVMITRADLSTLMALELNIGDLLIVCATVGYAGYGIVISRARLGVGPWTVLFFVNLSGGLAILPFYVIESLTFQTVPFSLKAVSALLVLAALVGLISIYFWNTGNRVVGHNRAAIFVNLLPVFGAALAITFLGEELHAYHLVSAALVIGGVLLVIGRG